MRTIHIDVADKVATYRAEDGAIVCGNADYQVEFAFDDEFAEHSNKTAVIIADDKRIDVNFTGNSCPMPMVSRVRRINIGVIVDGVLATTRAEIPCIPSIACIDVANTEDFVRTVSGVWVFNESVDCSTNIGQTVNFVSNSSNLVHIMTVALDNLMMYQEGVGPVFNNGSWTDEAYRIVDFGTEPQEVSEEFYTWLTANAVKR